MDSQKLYEIIQASTQVFRKGARVDITENRDANVRTTEFFDYAHTSDAPQTANHEKVDMIFVDVVVDKTQAEKQKQDLTRLLEDYPQPERLAGGPSYIELAPNIGLEQESALRLMALGKSLGMWEIISGKTFGMSDDEAKALAGQGMLNISGYNNV